jgi:hypothetical protein
VRRALLGGGRVRAPPLTSALLHASHASCSKCCSHSSLISKLILCSIKHRSRYAVEAPAGGVPSGIDAAAAVVFRVSVERVVSEGEMADADSRKCVWVAEQLKNDGNRLIAQGYSHRALHKYQRSLEIIAKFAPQPQAPPPLPGFPPNFSHMGGGASAAPDNASAHALHCVLLSNVAACYLRMRKWNATINVCCELLDKQVGSALKSKPQTL